MLISYENSPFSIPKRSHYSIHLDSKSISCLHRSISRTRSLIWLNCSGGLLSWDSWVLRSRRLIHRRGGRLLSHASRGLGRGGRPIVLRTALQGVHGTNGYYFDLRGDRFRYVSLAHLPSQQIKPSVCHHERRPIKTSLEKYVSSFETAIATCVLICCRFYSCASVWTARFPR